MVLHGFAFYCIVLHDTAKPDICHFFTQTKIWYWYCMVLHGITWFCMVLHGIAGCCMVLQNIVSYCTVLYGMACHCIVLYDIKDIEKY